VNRDLGPGGNSFIQQTAGVNEIDGSLYLRLGSYVGFTFLRGSRSTMPASSTSKEPRTRRERQSEGHGLALPRARLLLRLISRCNCWVVEAGVADKFNPDERLFRVQFTLVGLGSFGRSPANRNYVGLGPLTTLGYRRSGVGPGTGGIY
jgi:hypothetical protein